jgi:hypothetical protein
MTLRARLDRIEAALPRGRTWHSVRAFPDDEPGPRIAWGGGGVGQPSDGDTVVFLITGVPRSEVGNEGS